MRKAWASPEIVTDGLLAAALVRLRRSFPSASLPSCVNSQDPAEVDHCADRLFELFRKSHDSAVFGLLYDLTYPTLRNATVRRLPRSDRSGMVEDVLAETYLHILEHGEEFCWKGRGSFLKWAHSIARNVVYLNARRSSRRRRREAAVAEREVDGRDDPVLGMMLREQRLLEQTQLLLFKRAVDQAFAELPAQGQQALRLASEQRSYHEICKDMGITVGALTMRVKRAKARLNERVSQILRGLEKTADRVSENAGEGET